MKNIKQQNLRLPFEKIKIIYCIINCYVKIKKRVIYKDYLF